MNGDRTAVDTITGYYYQFDYYILEILSRTNPNDVVTIEAIEDVDIHSGEDITAVQCKYYAKQEYNHSVIAPAIRLMLSHFKTNINRDKTNYRIYGHFRSGQGKYTSPISVKLLRARYLTYTSKSIRHEYDKELGLTDADLHCFLDHLYIDVNAPEFSAQEGKILKTLRKIFHCTEYDAEYYYYNNALRLIRELATQQDMSQRSISKADFLTQINQKNYLFESWYLEYRGLKAYCASVKSQYFSQINISPYERFFLIECDHQISEQQIESLLLKISKNWSRLSQNEPRPFCPYIYLHGVSEHKILNIKQLLQGDSVYFWDGYDFKGADFQAKSIVRRATSYNGIKLKFITEQWQIDDILNSISATSILYEFFLDCPFYNNEKHQVQMIRIQNTQNIENMI